MCVTITRRYMSKFVVLCLLLCFYTGVCFADTGYVVDQNSNDIIVLDLSSGTILKHIPTSSGGPTEIVLSPDGYHFYVTIGDYPFGKLDAFDVEGLSYSSVGVGPVPVALDVLPDNSKVYTADWLSSNWVNSSVSVVDVATMTKIATITTPFLTNEVKVSHDGSRLYVLSLYANDIKVVDTASDTIIDTIPLGRSGARHICLTPDDSYAYVVFAGEILKIDLANKNIIKTIMFDASGSNANNMDLDIVIDKNGKFAYVNGLTTVNVIDLSIDENIFTVQIGKPLNDIALGSNDEYIYVCTDAQSITDIPYTEVVKISTDTYTIVSRYVIGGDLAGLFVLFEKSPYDLLINLLNQVNSMSLSNGIKTPLTAKILVALAHAEDNNEKNNKSIVSILDDFIQTVISKTGKGISEAEASLLIADAEEIIMIICAETSSP